MFVPGQGVVEGRSNEGSDILQGISAGAARDLGVLCIKADRYSTQSCGVRSDVVVARKQVLEELWEGAALGEVHDQGHAEQIYQLVGEVMNRPTIALHNSSSKAPFRESSPVPPINVSTPSRP